MPILSSEPTSGPQSTPSDLGILTTKIKNKLKLAEYDRTLKRLAEQAVEKLKRVRGDHSAVAFVSTPTDRRLEYLTALGWGADVMEYFGHVREGTDTYLLVKDEGPRISASLIDRSSPTTEIEMKIAREEVWVALSWSRALYRRHKYAEALQVLQRCEDFVLNKLQRKGFECHLTLAGLWSLHAKVLRQLVNLQDAKIYYDLALSRIYQRLEAGADARVNCEVARILAFGHGWILYTQGLLQEARAAVSTALVILHKTGDVISKAYGELLLCSVARARIGVGAAAGTEQAAAIDRPTLTEVIEAMQEPYDTFKEYGHKPYVARAAYELSLSYLYRGLSRGKMGLRTSC